MASTAMTTRNGGGVMRTPNPTGLAEVIDLILDKGLVIDVYLRVSLVGIELLTVDARIVVASVDTYLRFAEAVNRLDLMATETSGLPEMMEGITESGAESKTKGIVQGAKEAIFGDEDTDDEDEDEERPRRRRRRTASGDSEERPRRRRAAARK